MRSVGVVSQRKRLCGEEAKAPSVSAFSTPCVGFIHSPREVRPRVRGYLVRQRINERFLYACPWAHPCVLSGPACPNCPRKPGPARSLRRPRLVAAGEGAGPASRAADAQPRGPGSVAPARLARRSAPAQTGASGEGGSTLCFSLAGIW